MAQQPPYDNEDIGNEYQFNDDQGDNSVEYNYEQEPTPSGGKSPRSKTNLIIGIIIAIIVIFIIYKVISSMFGTRTPTESAAVSVPTQTTVQQQTTRATSSMQQKATKSNAYQQQAQQELAQVSKEKTADLTNAINQLKTLNQNLANKIEQQQFQSQTNVESMQQTISDLNSQLKTMSSKLNNLSSAFYNQQQMERRAAYAKAMAAKQAAAQLRQKKSYFVDAVIPGRAWLKGADGSAVTVAVGNELPGYGKVIAINPYSGEVRTSSGTIPYATSAN